MKKYIIFTSIPLISILSLSIIFSIINLFEISIHPSIYLISIILISLTLGYFIGINIKDKGYLKGLIAGSIFILILFLISIIITRNIKIYTLLYYIIIIICTTLSTMIGINKKK